MLLTEAPIAGGNARSMPASSLKDIWVGVAHDQGIECADIGVISAGEVPDHIDRRLAAAASGSDEPIPPPMLIGCGGGPFSGDLMKAASRLLLHCGGAGLICVTGSLHMVSWVLRQLEPPQP